MPDKDNFGAVIEPQYFESHPNDSRVTGPHDVGNTVSARYGTGGGNTPLVSQPFRKVRRAKSKTDFETWEKDEKANTLNCFDTGDVRSTNVVAQPVHAFKVRGGCEGGGKEYLGEDEKAFTLSATQDQQIAQPIAVDWRTAQVDIEKTGTLKTDLAKMSGPCIAVETPTIIDRAAFNQWENAQYDPRIEEGQTMSSLVAMGPHAVAQPIAVDCFNQTINDKTSQTIGSSASDVNHVGAVIEPTITIGNMAIRRLTPKECERLQGFPDDWTRIPYRKKPADQCPDGPRYKACGNSMAVPVMRWIGERIEKIEKMLV